MNHRRQEVNFSHELPMAEGTCSQGAAQRIRGHDPSKRMDQLARARTASVIVNFFCLSEFGFDVLLFNLIVNLPRLADLDLVLCVLVLLKPTHREGCA